MLYVICVIIGGVIVYCIDRKSIRDKIVGLISRRPPPETQQVLPYEDLTVKHQIERSKEKTK